MARHFPRQRHHAALPSNTWTWAPPMAGAWINRALIRGHCAPAVRTAAGAVLAATAQGEPRKRWAGPTPTAANDPGLGEIGVISSVTQAFCGDCNRARLSMEGLYLCLFCHPRLGSAQPAAQPCQRRADQHRHRPYLAGRGDRYSSYARQPASAASCEASAH